MKNFVLRWLPSVTAAAFVLNVYLWTVYGMGTSSGDGGGLLALGVVMGLIFGLATSIVGAGVVYLLISINEHLAELRKA